MDAITLRGTPRTKCVSILCNTLVAAPIAITMALGSSVLSRHVPEAVSTARADVQVTPPVTMTPPAIRSLPVPPLAFPKAPAQTTRAVPQVLQTSGLSLREDIFASDDGSAFLLEGLELLESSARCRRLDGIELSCRERIATRLEVLSKTHPIRCRITQTRDTATGRCASGKIDVSNDLVKAGLARPAPVQARS